VADVIRGNEHVRPSASKTDLYGEYGPPEVYTEWSAIYPSGREIPVLREHHWPGPDNRGDDARPCEHYARARVPGTSEGERT
jgi:hypothetical protein